MSINEDRAKWDTEYRYLFEFVEKYTMSQLLDIVAQICYDKTNEGMNRFDWREASRQVGHARDWCEKVGI